MPDNVLELAVWRPAGAAEADDDPPPADDPAPRPEATEPRAEATEPRAEATEPRAEATEPRAEATEPRAEATEPQPVAAPTDRPAMLLAATRVQVTPADREYLDARAGLLETRADERARYQAAEEIWTHAATLVVRSLTSTQQRRMLADGLQLWIWHGLPPSAVPQEQREVVEGFFGVMHGLIREVLRGLARDAAVRLLLPDSPGTQPLGFTDAIFTACELLESQPVG